MYRAHKLPMSIYALERILLTNEFKNHFFTGVHTAHYPNSMVKYCDVIFHPLSLQITPDQVYSFAMAIAEGKEL